MYFCRKEAQKCFCEAATCRGWLGEEPDDDDDEEEEEEEEDEDEEEDAEVQEAAKIEEEKVENKVDDVMKEKAEKTEVPIDGTELAIKVEKPKPVKKEKKEKKKKYFKRKPRKDLFEDLDVRIAFIIIAFHVSISHMYFFFQLDDEIASLVTTGLKNQAHTLKLSRLMVRAKEPPQRSKLLKLLRHGEFPCRRLFLDYHGLRLMHGWMTDAQHLVKVDKKFECLR